MMKISSFRWSRLAVASAWERLWRRWELFLIGLIMVGVVSIWWWNSCWMFGIPVLFILAICLVCTADDYCEVTENQYYFYKCKDRYVMEVHDYSGWWSEEVLAWEYENISERETALLYCDEDNCWSIVSRQACMKLGHRINKSCFYLDIPNICRVLETHFTIFIDGRVNVYHIRNVYAGKDLKFCFTKQEREALSEADLSSEYVVIQKMNGNFALWSIMKDAKAFFAAKTVGMGPSFITEDKGRVTLWVWNYEIYRYQEVFSDCAEALGVSGRFVKFKKGQVPVYATISEFNPETKKVEQIYEGFVSYLDFETGEYTV